MFSASATGLALVLDSDDHHAVIAQKGLIHARVQVFGKKAHGAYNWRGVNAIGALLGGVVAAVLNPHVSLAFVADADLPAPIRVATCPMD